MKKPLVSVIMNCRNGADFIDESVSSLLKQTYKHWELIFWDNASTDEGLKKIKTYKDKRIYIYKNSHLSSLGEARKKALKKIKGDYVSFLDVDDIWMKSKLKKQVSQFLKESDLGMVVSNEINFSSVGEKNLYTKKKLPTGYIAGDLITNYFISFSTIMIKSEYLKKYKITFDTKFNHISDFDFIFRIALVAKIQVIYDLLVKNRIHIKSGSYTQPENFYYEKIKFEKKIKKNYKYFYIKNKKTFTEFKKKYHFEYLKNLIMLKRYKKIKNFIKKSDYFNFVLIFFLRNNIFVNFISYLIKKNRLYI